MKAIVGAIGTAFLVGCLKAVPPVPPPPHSAMGIDASVSKTWDAVIDVFASKNIPIKTLDRSSGFIVAEEMRVGKPEGRGATSPYADCGSYNKVPFVPTHANYNIRVHGDSTRSTVQVTVFWKDVYDAKTLAVVQCSTKGVWETDAEDEIKRLAEKR
jgi:hypothetical protein